VHYIAKLRPLAQTLQIHEATMPNFGILKILFPPYTTGQTASARKPGRVHTSNATLQDLVGDKKTTDQPTTLRLRRQRLRGIPPILNTKQLQTNMQPLQTEFPMLGVPYELRE